MYKHITSPSTGNMQGLTLYLPITWTTNDMTIYNAPSKLSHTSTTYFTHIYADLMLVFRDDQSFVPKRVSSQMIDGAFSVTVVTYIYRPIYMHTMVICFSVERCSLFANLLDKKNQLENHPTLSLLRSSFLTHIRKYTSCLISRPEVYLNMSLPITPPLLSAWPCFDPLKSSR